jgi:hypothetical protein
MLVSNISNGQNVETQILGLPQQRGIEGTWPNYGIENQDVSVVS